MLGKIDFPKFKDPTPKEPFNGCLLPLKKLIITMRLMHYEYMLKRYSKYGGSLVTKVMQKNARLA